jgi:hypothetical protein
MCVSLGSIYTKAFTQSNVNIRRNIMRYSDIMLIIFDWESAQKLIYVKFYVISRLLNSTIFVFRLRFSYLHVSRGISGVFSLTFYIDIIIFIIVIGLLMPPQLKHRPYGLHIRRTGYNPHAGPVRISGR